jgi:hypothetical protein
LTLRAGEFKINHKLFVSPRLVILAGCSHHITVLLGTVTFCLFVRFIIQGRKENSMMELAIVICLILTLAFSGVVLFVENTPPDELSNMGVENKS